MKILSWLAKFRISNALDAPNSPAAPGAEPIGRPRGVGDAGDTRRFQARVRSLHRALSARSEPASAPAGLHAAIMSAVRNSTQGAPAGGTGFAMISRWALPAAAAVLVLAAGWLFLRPSEPDIHLPPGASLAPAGVALDVGEAVADEAPVAVVTPLQREWTLLNQDLEKTREALLAALPAFLPE